MKAFPNTAATIPASEDWKQYQGMDLRDYFAIHATDFDIYSYQVDDSNKEVRTRAEARYMFADEMMKAREQ